MCRRQGREAVKCKRILSYKDVDLHPYIALERGIATLYRSPQDR